jgi:hypothetical protein
VQVKTGKSAGFEGFLFAYKAESLLWVPELFTFCGGRVAGFRKGTSGIGN